MDITKTFCLSVPQTSKKYKAAHTAQTLSGKAQSTGQVLCRLRITNAVQEVSLPSTSVDAGSVWRAYKHKFQSQKSNFCLKSEEKLVYIDVMYDKY